MAHAVTGVAFAVQAELAPCGGSHRGVVWRIHPSGRILSGFLPFLPNQLKKEQGHASVATRIIDGSFDRQDTTVKEIDPDLLSPFPVFHLFFHFSKKPVIPHIPPIPLQNFTRFSTSAFGASSNRSTFLAQIFLFPLRASVSLWFLVVVLRGLASIVYVRFVQIRGIRVAIFHQISTKNAHTFHQIPLQNYSRILSAASFRYSRPFASIRG